MEIISTYAIIRANSVTANYTMSIPGISGLAKTVAASGGSLPYPATFIVNGNPIPLPGSLSIMPFAESELVIGESTTAVVSLSGSANVTDPVNVVIINNNPQIVSESPATCSLTTLNNSCIVTFTAQESGSATFTATANNYESVTSDSLEVNKFPILINVTGYTSGESLIQSQDLTIAATLGGLSQLSESVSVTNSDTLLGLGIIVVASPDPCTLQSGVNEACTFSILPLWNITLPGSYQVLLASSGGILSESVLSFSSYAPTIYLPQTGATSTVGNYTVPLGGDGNPAVGLAWPNPRFTRGSDIESNCITDNLTGLQWVANAGTFPAAYWTDALLVVESMNSSPTATAYSLCGYTDWRLPNVNELSSLTNDGYTDGSGSFQYSWLQSQGFTNFKNNYRYWTSSINVSNPPRSWYVGFTDGGISSNAESTLQYILPVSGGQQ